MSQFQWTELVREMGEALEQELASAMSVARRASVRATRDHDPIRLALEVSFGSQQASPEAPAAELEAVVRLQYELNEALRELASANAGLTEMTRRVAEAERQRDAARVGARKLKAQLRELEALHLDAGAPSENASRLEDAEEIERLQNLNADLQREISELWRVLRETRPGDSMAITLTMGHDADGANRREGVERVQAKILDARERFRRRSRWPIAI